MSAAVVVANLDGELEFARAAGHDLQLPEAVLSGLAAVGSLLRVFASEGELLELPRPLDPRRMLPVAGLPRPEPVVRGSVRPGTLRWAWMQTPAVAAATDAAAVAALTPRAACLELARELGVALPGAATVADTAELRAHLAAGGAAAAPDGRWVLKADWTAAGRGLLLGGPGAPDDALARRVDQLAARHGALLFEPWLAGQVACGVAGEVLVDESQVDEDQADGRVRCEPAHLQRVDARGRFRGLRVVLGEPHAEPHVGAHADRPGTELTAREACSLADFAERLGARLAARGLRGPFALDALVHDVAGERRLHPLIELNPRASFGHVAWALARRLAPTHGWQPGDSVELVLAREPPPAAGDDVLALLAPGPPDDWAAWLVRRPG